MRISLPSGKGHIGLVLSGAVRKLSCAPGPIPVCNRQPSIGKTNAVFHRWPIPEVRNDVMELATKRHKIRILCWFSKTDAGFQNPALDFQIPRWFSKPNTSFQNPALNFEILRWFLKTGTGFQNPALDSQIPR